ncbi:hypothetical protein T265_02917 [Opisthorchis viverrini]|uniref:Uncharacterized protein n=1 Tax=Opisthorchis viverrini TaxID=6198 RepID=A0A075A535_OPIVI|nr:hypothetical protein T265_02917 [Opisthorchis viverrini]KER30675.1 hypothetical protein T265_02917 [Opisthorchis viverrini]
MQAQTLHARANDTSVQGTSMLQVAQIQGLPVPSNRLSNCKVIDILKCPYATDSCMDQDYRGILPVHRKLVLENERCEFGAYEMGGTLGAHEYREPESVR